MVSLLAGKSAVRRALLICNGDPPSKALAKKLELSSDIVVAADGGANRARACGITPHVVIGDLDSLTDATRKAFPKAKILRVRRQDNTDMEKALDYLRLKRYRDVVIVGTTGGRIDFTLANMAVVWRYVPALRVILAGDGWTIIPTTEDTVLRAKKGTLVSIIPAEPSRGITLGGMKYPLVNASMKTGQLGVSNVVTISPFHVRVRDGKLLIVVSAELSDIVVEHSW